MKTILNFVLILTAMTFVSCAHKGKDGKPETSKGSATSPCKDSVCYLKIDAYPQEVAVLVPPYADYSKVTIFLQDFSSGRVRDQNLQNLMTDLDIVKSFKGAPQTGRILVVPFTTGKNADYRKNLKNQADVHNLIFNLYKTFGMKTSGYEVQLVAHGESHYTVQQILRDNMNTEKLFTISQITILDGTTSTFEPRLFNRWLATSDQNLMTVIFRKGALTEAKAQELWKLYSGEKLQGETGINLDRAQYLTVIPELQFKGNSDAHWMIAKKWLARVL